MNYPLITIDELKAIDEIWDDELDFSRRTLVELYYEISGEKLPWDDFKEPLIDKETKKFQTFKRIALSDKLIISPDFFYTQSDGRFTFILSPEEILNSGDEAFISQFPGLKEDDNPILMFAELK